MARGDLPPEIGPRRLVCVFISPVTEFLLHFGRDIGYETIMMDPDSGRLAWAEWRYADSVYSVPTEDWVDRTTDVVFTDHDREELGPTLEAFPGGLSKAPFRWEYLGRPFDMEFLAGFVGVAQDPETLALRPEIGWAVREAAETA